eukprot:9751938-Heterocapsa_arctica.AAC.1
MTSSGFGLCTRGRVVAAFVKYSISAGPTYSFRRDEVTPKSDAHARDPFVWCHDGSFGRVQGCNPLVVLMLLITNVFQSANVVNIVGLMP